MKKKSKKIALIGTAPSSMGIAPYDDPSWTIWACSPAAIDIPRADVLFEVHRYRPGSVSFPEVYCDHLKAFEGDVYTPAPIDGVNCKDLPWNDLVDKYGPYFFTSSLSWMFAMAIEAGADEIGLWGVDMAAQVEYKDQKLGCQYFATLAAARGINVFVPPESDLFRPNPLYGICQHSHAWIKQTEKLKEYNAKLTEANNKFDTAKQERQFWLGAIDDQDYNMKTWFGQMEEQEYTTPPNVPVLENEKP